MVERREYLDVVLTEMAKEWSGNRTINIVCYGHSVPSGYFATRFKLYEYFTVRETFYIM